MIRILMAMIALGMTWGLVELAGNDATVYAKDKKKEKDPQEGKKGTAIGTLVTKGETYIEVKADGEEKGRKYVPHWRGGSPKDGGGPDKEMLKTFRELKVGSRIEVEWHFEEHLRAVKVKVIKAAKEKDNQ